MHNNNIPHADEMVTTKELYHLTKLKPRFWEARRLSGDTPPFIRLSEKCVRYRWGDVQEWLQKRIRTSTSDQGDSHGK